MSARPARTRVYRLAVVEFGSDKTLAKVETKKIKEKVYGVGNTVTVEMETTDETSSSFQGEIRFLHGELYTFVMYTFQYIKSRPSRSYHSAIICWILLINMLKL